MSEITVVAPDTGRDAYRVVPDPDDPVILQIDGQLVRVLEISATGFASPADAVPRGRRYPFALDLPTGARAVAGYVDVLPENRHGSAEARFVDLSAEEIDALHHYVLVRQKDVIRSLRAGRLG